MSLAGSSRSLSLSCHSSGSSRTGTRLEERPGVSLGQSCLPATHLAPELDSGLGQSINFSRRNTLPEDELLGQLSHVASRVTLAVVPPAQTTQSGSSRVAFPVLSLFQSCHYECRTTRLGNELLRQLSRVTGRVTFPFVSLFQSYQSASRITRPVHTVWFLSHHISSRVTMPVLSPGQTTQSGTCPVT